MKPTPTLEDLAAELAAQDAQLTVTAQLARSIPSDVALDEAVLADFDARTAPLGVARPLGALGVRA